MENTNKEDFDVQKEVDEATLTNVTLEKPKEEAVKIAPLSQIEE
jgi:hypothetical protein